MKDPPDKPGDDNAIFIRMTILLPSIVIPAKAGIFSLRHEDPPDKPGDDNAIFNRMTMLFYPGWQTARTGMKMVYIIL